MSGIAIARGRQAPCVVAEVPAMPTRSVGSAHRAEEHSSGEHREPPVQPRPSPVRARYDRRASRSARRRSAVDPAAGSDVGIRVRHGGSPRQVSAEPDFPAYRSLPGAPEPEFVARVPLAPPMSPRAAARATEEPCDPFPASETTASACEFVQGCGVDGSRYRAGADQVSANVARSRPWLDLRAFSVHRAKCRRRDPIALGVFFWRPPLRCRVWPPCIEPRSGLLLLDVARHQLHRFRLEGDPVPPATSHERCSLHHFGEPFPCVVEPAEVDDTREVGTDSAAQAESPADDSPVHPRMQAGFPTPTAGCHSLQGAQGDPGTTAPDLVNFPNRPS